MSVLWGSRGVDPLGKGSGEFPGVEMQDAGTSRHAGKAEGDGAGINRSGETGLPWSCFGGRHALLPHDAGMAGS